MLLFSILQGESTASFDAGRSLMSKELTGNSDLLWIIDIRDSLLHPHAII
jgi:hypothetical protein